MDDLSPHRPHRLRRLRAPAAMEEIARLQKLSLVSKVCTELENNCGVNDAALAEFLIAMASESASGEEFSDKLDAMEAGFEVGISPLSRHPMAKVHVSSAIFAPPAPSRLNSPAMACCLLKIPWHSSALMS